MMTGHRFVQRERRGDQSQDVNSARRRDAARVVEVRHVPVVGVLARLADQVDQGP